ncbi:hypothetical protein [Streptomyces sp. NPDC048411]|uniref:hypothetical protein n=1 Tax=Streptomyces sp. NPDC048411 TaxID=3157206 RepID=UPI00345544B3
MTARTLRRTGVITAKAEQDRLVDLFGIITTHVMSPPMRSLDAAETARIAACLDQAGLSHL